MMLGEEIGGSGLPPRAVRVRRGGSRVALAVAHVAVAHVAAAHVAVAHVAAAHVAVALLGLGCVSSGPVRGSPLYPGAPRPLDQVATLTGYVAEVDGQDVTPLLP